VLKQQEVPEIWVAAGAGCSFLENFSLVLSELPSKGKLFSEDDRRVIKVTVKPPLFVHISFAYLSTKVCNSMPSFANMQQANKKRLPTMMLHRQKCSVHGICQSTMQINV
jgi:hypothetical protein